MKHFLSLIVVLLSLVMAAEAQDSFFGYYVGRFTNGDDIAFSITKQNVGTAWVFAYSKRYFDVCSMTFVGNQVVLSGSAGRSGVATLGGGYSVKTINGTFAGVTFTSSLEPWNGPTRFVTGEYRGTLLDSIARSMAVMSFLITPNGKVLFAAISVDKIDGGLGTIAGDGRFNVRTVLGDAYSGTFSDSGGTASGTLAVFGYGNKDFFLNRGAQGIYFNISTRGHVGTGEQVMIAGFIITDFAKLVFIRVLGPSLALFGVNGALADPVAEVYDQSGKYILYNDDWEDAPNMVDIRTLSYAPLNPKDCGILARLEPGAYTVIVRGKNNSTGVALVEVNEVR